MSSCPQCHAEFSLEELDASHPTCPVCGESLKRADEEAEEVETQAHDPLKGAPKIDGFEITRHIGRGGMGDVWEARQNVLGRKVAIKVLAKNLSHSEHFLARFTREAFTLGRLQHPGIVSIYDFRSSPDGLCCIIMEYVEGPKREPTTLYDLIISKELTPDRTRFLILQVLHSLQYAHEEGVIHRDIKPTNVLIDRYGRVKVVDFGIAAMPADPNRKQLTYVGGPLGTAEYMAPEQTEDATKADHRADLYAVGVVIYEMLTGTRPRGAFRPPSQVRKGIDVAWDAIVTKALQPDREDRYADADKMIADIQAIRGAHSIPIAPSLPVEFQPLPEGFGDSPVAELPFDKEPEEFLGEKTPLPINTPTAALDPDQAAAYTGEKARAKPNDTDPLLEEDEEPHIPSWMLKHRGSAEVLDDTQAASSDGSPASVLEEADQGSSMDSSLRLDRQMLAELAEEVQDIPEANVEDLEHWLSAGPAPGGNDSSQLIEVAGVLPATVDHDDKEETEQGEDSSDVVPLVDSALVNTPAGSFETLTKEDPDEADEDANLPPFSEEALPEGDFIELSYHAYEAKPTPGDKAIPFRPAIRPPTIKLCVLDDGSSREGEWYRIRQPSFVIGRKEGDIIIEHDRSMSGRHAEIVVEKNAQGITQFIIRDLKTTNGTFARASRAILEDGQELLLGYRRYKLLCNQRENPHLPAFDLLVEVTKRSKGKAYRLGKPPVVIGRDPTQCDLLVLDDPFMSSVHAVMKKDQRNRWVIKNYNARNGIWIQIKEMKLVSGGEFQIGSQRFIVKLS